MKQTSHVAKRLACLLLVALLAVAFTAGASAEVFRSFTYNTSDVATAAPDAVYYDGMIDAGSAGVAIGVLTDLHFDAANNYLYAVDSTNNRILRMDPNGKLIKSIAGFDNSGTAETFNVPTGIFLDAEQHLFIADTENARIVELDKNDRLVRIVNAPVSTVLGDTFQFKPTHLVLDSLGRFYIISQGFNQGVLCLDENGVFLNCTGTPRVEFDFADYLWKLISTDEQKDRMVSFVPTEYNNIAIDSEDFLYVTCDDYNVWSYIGGAAEILRRLNAKGEDILVSDNGFKPYGMRRITKNGSFAGGAVYEDVIALSDDMFAAVDRNRGRVFVYNGESQLLFEFGTNGPYAGAFLKAQALEYHDGTFYVADADKGSITLYKQNEYGNLLMSTSALHKAGKYEAEEKIWDTVFTYNANSTIALVGLANMEYRNGDYAASMEHFQIANLSEDYSKVFKAYRQELLNDYSAWIVIGLAAVLVLLIVGFKCYKKHLASDNYNPSHYAASLEYARVIGFRPLSRFWDLTWEKKGTLAGGLTIFGIVEVIMILEAYCSGYIFSGQSLMLTNPVTVVFKVPVLLLLYCICNWCVTSLMDGKGTFKNILMANCYALTPIIFLIPASIFISNFITAEESSFYNMLILLAYFWVIVLILCANRQIHDYSMSKSVATLIITVVVMVIVVFLFVLFMVLMQQMFAFIAALFEDIAARFI